jgi:hypothetical protein
MPEKLQDKQDICYNCNMYHISCHGEMFKRPEKGYKKGCINQVRSEDNTKSKIQVAAFGSLYRAKRRGGTERLQAFVEAIAQTSDEVFANAKLKNPHLIKQWNK